MNLNLNLAFAPTSIFLDRTHFYESVKIIPVPYSFSNHSFSSLFFLFIFCFEKRERRSPTASRPPGLFPLPTFQGLGAAPSLLGRPPKAQPAPHRPNPSP